MEKINQEKRFRLYKGTGTFEVANDDIETVSLENACELLSIERNRKLYLYIIRIYIYINTVHCLVRCPLSTLHVAFTVIIYERSYQ